MTDKDTDKIGGITVTGKIKLHQGNVRFGSTEGYVYSEAAPSRGGPPFDGDDFVMLDEPMNGKVIMVARFPNGGQEIPHFSGVSHEAGKWPTPEMMRMIEALRPRRVWFKPWTWFR